MSIIIQFNSPSYIQSTGVVPSNIPCRSKTVKLEMVPGIEHPDVPVMTDDEGSIIDISASNTVFATALKDVRTSHYCFGLPYQDHNYGAPPPPTPPSYSPCPSPAAVIAIADEDTNHSVISTTTEEAPEESVTRCICGFEHDDEYMICCDNCLVWQHVDCMGLDRNNIPETYHCEKCEPRKLDRHKAKLLQARKKVVLTKSPPAKQENSANNLNCGRNIKKKTVIHSPEQWHQVTSVSQPQRVYGSTDSEDDSKITDRRPKTRSKRRKKEEEKEQSTRKNKMLSKHGRERMEIKRSRLRRNKNKESTSTADEEAQDAWAFSTEWCEENFESAVTNQYTPEVQHLARMLRPQGYEKKFFEQLQSRQCHVLDDGKKKQLVSLYDIPRNQPLIEYKGKYLLASQFHDLHPLYNKRLYPYVLFYTVEQSEICVDSSMYGNDARFVRRSCKPNAIIRHMSYNGNLHLFLQSTKVIFSEDEVTVPLNFNQCDSLKDIVCACGTEDCLLKPKKRNGSVEVCHEKRRRTRRSTVSAEDESSQSVGAVAPPEKPKISPIKHETPEPQDPPSELNEQDSDIKAPSDHDAEEQSIESKKKMTREQRKIEAYMRAFNQMEKAARRKQQALERLKAQQPKSEEPTEKSDCLESALPKEEEKLSVDPVVPEKEIPIEEEIKVQPPAPPKTKKGKKRRGSGNPSRRRTRTNSGGSEILPFVEEIKHVIIEPPPVPETPAPIPEPIVEPAPLPICSEPLPVEPTPDPAEESPKVLKTKRSLLQGWLQEKSEETTSSTPTSSPCSIHTEMKWNVSAASATCYVRCTKDTPHSGGISAAHLRRSNSSGHLRAMGSHGSAKKRWLRQAMHDCTEEPLSMDSSSMEHLDNACLSPICHGDVDSPGGAGTDDILTPLKKRRLLRESIESLSSPHSPSLENGLDDTDATTSSLTNDIQSELKIDTMDQHLLCAANDNSIQLSLKEEGDSTFEVSDLRTDLAEIKEAEDKHEIICDVNVSVSTSTENTHNKDEPVSSEFKLYKEEETYLQTDSESTMQFNSASTMQINNASTMQADDAGTMQNDDAGTMQADDAGTMQADDAGTMQANDAGTMQADDAGTMKANDAGTMQADNAGTMQTDDASTVQADSASIMQAGSTSTMQIDCISIMQTDCISTIQTDYKSTTQLDYKNGIEADCTDFKQSEITMQTDCDLEPILNGDICSETIKNASGPTLSQDDCIKTISHLNQHSLEPDSVSDSECHSHGTLKDVSSEAGVTSINSVNQSVEAIETEDTNKEQFIAQKQSLDPCTATTTLSPVNKASTLRIKCTSPITFPLTSSIEIKIELPEPIEHLSLVESCENYAEKIDINSIESSIEDNSGNSHLQEFSDMSSTNKITPEISTVNADDTMQTVNRDNHNMSDRPSNLSVTFEKTVCSTASSCSNIVNSSIVDSSVQMKQTVDHSNNADLKANGVNNPQVQTRCTTPEDLSPIKACASATQKRKVSLSEYRMRMRENTNKNRSNSEPGKSSVDGTPVTITPEKLPAQVTLAPLPLFDIGDSPNKKSVIKKKKDAASSEDSNQDEHRENLNERLRREFGFDVSEVSGPTSLIQAKSKCNNQTTSNPPCISNLPLDPQSLPPPPPPPPPRGPPRPLRSPQTIMGGVPASIPSRFGFVHPSFSRPPYMVPQVSGATPYIATQVNLAASVIPPVHQMTSTTTSPCNIRAPLLPSTHSFTSSLPGTLLRAPTGHEFTPVNAQRFAMVSQPQLTHKTYPHVYQSGLYK